MLKKEVGESEKVGEALAGEMETFGLYDKIKNDMYELFKAANKNLGDINKKDLPVGRNEIPYQYYGPEFVSQIIELWMYLTDKIDYVSDKECHRLHELQEYYDGKKDLGKMTFKEAKYYFKLEKRLLEKLGIFRFEIPKLSGAQAVDKEAVEE